MSLIIRDENLASFVGERSEHYLQKWDVFENSSEKISWNWSAFFFSAYWMMYRKMYIPALLVFGSARVIKYILFLSAPHSSHRSSTLLMSIVIGIFGNWVYYRYATRKVGDVANTMGTDDPLMLAPTLRQIGGTSLLWVIVLGIAGSAADAVVFKILSGHVGDINTFDADTLFDAL